MPNIAAVLKEEIARIARKEVRSQTQKLHKAAAQYRRDIASLKRAAAALKAQVVSVDRRTKNNLPATDVESAEGTARFSAKGLVSHRKLLGLSAADYGSLAGASGVSIYKWERGSNRPRQAQITKLVSIRALRKREALQRLAEIRSQGARAGKAKRVK